MSNDVSSCEDSEVLLNIQQSTVSPENVGEGDIRVQLDVARTLECEPPEGRKLFFEDGNRRIDYVLAWSHKSKDVHKDHEEQRMVFEENLEHEGLELEYDIKMEREVNYVKIHAPWDVLCRYAEIMKVRMPMKEVPEELSSLTVWEMMTDMMVRLLSPFELDPNKVPPLPKKFTCIFERDKQYLFAIPKNKDLFFSHAVRSLIVEYILRRKRYGSDSKDVFAFGIQRLMAHDVYTAAYPLHEGSWKARSKPSMRRLLYEHWAHWTNFYKVQPLDYIRTYFGEKIGMYFAWLGYYTYMLIPASIVGLIVFIYGCVTLNSNIIAKEICDSVGNYTMCPKCNRRCPYWDYSASCTYVRASHLFDNGATVFFAVFMSFWGTIFLEFWKREQSGIQFQWNVLSFEEEEEPPRPDYLVRLQNSKYNKTHHVSGEAEPYLPFWRKKFPVYVASIAVMVFMILVAFAVVLGVIIYRMALLSVFYLQNSPIIYKNASLLTSATAALINLVIIFILNALYNRVAVKLTNWETHRTQSEYDRSLNVKLYILQFVNFYSSIFYIAFFKGKFIGRPGAYNTMFGARQEECQTGGCLMELCMQLAIVFVGKQFLQNNIMEIIYPRVKKAVKRLLYNREQRKDGVNRAPWEKDYILEPAGPRTLFYEYLEMLLQFGFVTIFVAAFPLAPLFALLNNIVEIRADANKFVTQIRRPRALRSQNIGIWFDILKAVSHLAVLTNACIIAFTSGFIHRLVYRIHYSPTGSYHGFVNYRYPDYRSPPWAEKRYGYTIQYWHVLAAQVTFVVLFENLVIVLTSLLSYVIPDMPRRLREQVRRENYLTNEIIVKTELEIAKGEMKNREKSMQSMRRRIRSLYELQNDAAGILTQQPPILGGGDATAQV